MTTNLFAATTALGVTTYLVPANTTANVLLSNSAASGKTYKINQIVAANTTGSAANVTVSIDNQAGGTGTDYPVVSAVSVPANASLIVVDKTTAIYLMENQSIVVTSGTSSAITYTISYEDIS